MRFQRSGTGAGMSAMAVTLTALLIGGTAQAQDGRRYREAPDPYAAARPDASASLGADSADYYWIDTADGLLEAIGDAPPDFTFDFRGEDAWGWETRDGDLVLAEETDEGAIRYFYYAPDADAPFLVQQLGWSFAYSGRRLAMVYDSDGAALPPDQQGVHERRARSLYTRGVALREAAAGEDRWQSVDAGWWAGQMASVIDLRLHWESGRARHPGWRQWRGSADALRWRMRLERERERRRIDGQRFRDWQRRGFGGPPPRFEGPARPGRPGAFPGPFPGMRPPGRPVEGGVGPGRPGRPFPGRPVPERPGERPDAIRPDAGQPGQVPIMRPRPGTPWTGPGTGRPEGRGPVDRDGEGRPPRRDGEGRVPRRDGEGHPPRGVPPPAPSDPAPPVAVTPPSVTPPAPRPMRPVRPDFERPTGERPVRERPSNMWREPMRDGSAPAPVRAAPPPAPTPPAPTWRPEPRPEPQMQPRPQPRMEPQAPRFQPPPPPPPPPPRRVDVERGNELPQ